MPTKWQQEDNVLCLFLGRKRLGSWSVVNGKLKWGSGSKLTMDQMKEILKKGIEISVPKGLGKGYKDLESFKNMVRVMNICERAE